MENRKPTREETKESKLRMATTKIIRKKYSRYKNFIFSMEFLVFTIKMPHIKRVLFKCCI